MTLSLNKVAGRVLVGVLIASICGGAIYLVAKATVDPEALYEQALAEVEAGRFPQAEKTLDRLERARRPTTLDVGLRARVAIGLERDDDAIRLLAQIPRDHALAGWAALRIGQLHRTHHRLREAEVALRKALEIEPNQVDAHRELIYILGLQLRRRELNEEFRAVSERSTLTPKEAWVWCMVRDLAWWAPEEHAPLIRKAIEADPADAWSMLALAEVERRQGHYAEAESLLARNQVDHAPTIAARAEIVLEKQGADAALALLNASPKSDEPIFNSLRGRIALTRREGEAAVKYLGAALEAEPGRRGLTSDLGKAWLALGNEKKAKSLLDQAGKIDALNNLLLQSEGKFDRVDPARWRGIASACEAAGRIHEARAWLNLLLKVDPLDSEIQRALFRVNQRIEQQKTGG